MPRSESRSVTSATSKSRSTHEGLISASRSRSATSFSRDRPATAHRHPLGACAARYSAVNPPVNPVAPKSTTSNSRPTDMGKHPSPTVPYQRVATLQTPARTTRRHPPQKLGSDRGFPRHSRRPRPQDQAEPQGPRIRLRPHRRHERGSQEDQRGSQEANPQGRQP